MPLYEEKLINPLSVRFSQDRIWPDFQDGTPIDDSLKLITSVPTQDTYYDCVLRPPFPPMEIIRLKQERREADGERIKDDKGRRLYGQESWFTFDNRRLYCLQRAALQMWPMSVAVVVKVLYDFPAVRCARHKFRTTSDGCSVKISLPDGQPGSLWNWEEAAKSVRTANGNSPAVLNAISKDNKNNSKEMLVDVPPIEQLSPGTRGMSVAERFNMGASSGGSKDEGKAAGMQLLNLIKNGGDSADGGGGGGGGGGGALAALFGQVPPPAGANFGGPSNSGGQSRDASGGYPNKGKGKGKGKDKGRGGGGRGAGGGGKGKGDEDGQNRRRRRPKGGGKGDVQ